MDYSIWTNDRQWYLAHRKYSPTYIAFVEMRLSGAHKPDIVRELKLTKQQYRIIDHRMQNAAKRHGLPKVPKACAFDTAELEYRKYFAKVLNAAPFTQGGGYRDVGYKNRDRKWVREKMGGISNEEYNMLRNWVIDNGLLLT